MGFRPVRLIVPFPPGGSVDLIASSPEEFSTHLKNELNKWGKVIKERGMRAG